MTTMLTECKMVDSFRARNPEAKANYTYWSVRTKARGDNKGLRLCAPDQPLSIDPRCPVAMSLTCLLVLQGLLDRVGVSPARGGRRGRERRADGARRLPPRPVQGGGDGVLQRPLPNRRHRRPALSHAFGRILTMQFVPTSRTIPQTGVG
eukprot:COSAG04_NODE_4181_length_2251_cov_22.131041_3_plen_150_part_00